MSEEQNAIVSATPISLDAMPQLPQKYGDNFLAGMASKWLPRLQLNSSSSGIGKAHPELIGSYAIVRSDVDYTVVGKNPTVLPLAFRPLALDMRDSPPKSYHDVNSQSFQTIKNIADTVKDSNCVWGAQFLLWMPNEQQFVTFGFLSWSARPVAQTMRQFINKSAKMGYVMSKPNAKKQIWQIPTVEAGPPFTNMPTLEELTEQVERFNNPATEVVEVATAAADNEKR